MHGSRVLNWGLAYTDREPGRMNRSIEARRAAAMLVLAVLLTACSETLAPNARVQRLEAGTGGGQQGVVATRLTQPVIVKAVDREGRPVRGATVVWSASGGGTVTAVTDVTGDDGTVSANWTLGTTAGEQTATATLGLLTATFRATAVAGPATTIAVVPGAAVLDAIGATTQLQASAQDAHGNPVTGRAFTWSSNAEAVATVSPGGLVTARTPGAARVRATLDAANGDAQITVQPQPATITLTPPAAQFAALGAQVQFQAAARDRNGNPVAVPAAQFVWSSSAPAIVNVSPTGLATAQANGAAQVRATIGNVVGSAQVVVQQVAATLAVVPTVDTLTTARPFTQLSAVARDANNNVIAAPFVTWVSANTAIALVNAFGQVNAVANGTVQIRATSGALVDSAAITVRLNAPPKAVADTRATLKDTPLVLAAPGVLANDTLGVPAATILSFGGGSLGGTVTTNAAGTTVNFGTGGSLRLDANGALAFTPSTGFTGSFTLQYRLQNAAGLSDATITIDVGLGPVAVDDALATASSTTLDLAAPGLLANDTLGFPLAAIVSFGGGTLGGTAASFQAGSGVAFGVGGFTTGGFLRVNANGSLTITPPAGYTGPITFLYRLSNGSGTSDGTVTVTVGPVPAPEPEDADTSPAPPSRPG